MAAEDLVLKVDVTAYNTTLTTLEGYVTQLKNLAGQYESKRSEIATIWTEDNAEQYTQAIDENIRKVNTAIQAVQEQIAQIKNLLEKKEYTSGVISSAVTAAIQVAKELFT